jgi:opacity protein-like surface antigen
MRKLIGGTVVVAMLISLAAAAHAQRRAAAGGAKHEFGVDVGAGYLKPDGVDGGIFILTPLNVRVGMVKPGKTMWEPRLSLAFSTVGGATTYTFEPGVNVLIANRPGGHRNGMYFTGGAGLHLEDDGANSGTAFALNGGVGWRKPYGSAAWRYELGLQYTSENTTLGLPSTITIGARLGISLWH